MESEPNATPVNEENEGLETDDEQESVESSSGRTSGLSLDSSVLRLTTNTTSGRSRGRVRGRGRRGRVGGRGRGAGRERGGGRGRGGGFLENRPVSSEWSKTNQFLPDLPAYDQTENENLDRDVLTPVEYFNQYFDDTFFKLITEQSNIHYLQQHGKECKLNLAEIKTFVGCTLLMSTLGYPRIRLYWQKQFRVGLIADNLSRDRYFVIRNNIHFVNNADVTDEMKGQDKLWKVRPIINNFQQAVLRLPRENNVCIDEQMIPFCGHVSLRQYVPRKPNPTGLKNYVLAGKSGKILDFEIYQGPTSNFPDESNKKLGTGGRAVLRLIQTCLPGTNIYFDRYFTSVALLDVLKDKGISGTGTIIRKRFPNLNLKSDGELKREGRGSYDYCIRNDKKMTIVKWMDNRPVIMASTLHCVTPTRPVKRYSKVDKRYIEVSQPNIIKHYNDNMGGVDLTNRLIALYRSYHRTKKWPVRVLEHFLDSAVVNSWLQYKENYLIRKLPKQQMLDLHIFKLSLAEHLILDNSVLDDSSFEEPPTKRVCVGRPGKVTLPAKEVRKLGSEHLPIAEDLKDAARCRNENCSGRTRVRCSKCNIFLCILKNRNCFFEFHA